MCRKSLFFWELCIFNMALIFFSFTWCCSVVPYVRSDAQRAAKQKERKEKELELCAFNAEQIEDSHHTHSLVSTANSTILQHFIPLQLPFWSIHFILLKSITNLLLETRTLWGKGSKDSGTSSRSNITWTLPFALLLHSILYLNSL